jgi:hypothetical protein
VVSISKGLPEEDRLALEREGIRVQFTVPAWAKNEVWLGVDLESVADWSATEILEREA